MHFLKKLGWLTSPKLSSLAACECTSAFKWFRQSSDAQRCLLRSITRQTKTFPRKLARKSSYTTFRLLLESHNLPQKKKKLCLQQCMCNGFEPHTWLKQHNTSCSQWHLSAASSCIPTLVFTTGMCRTTYTHSAYQLEARFHQWDGHIVSECQR